MRRAAACLTVLVLACSLAGAGASASQAPKFAHASAKCAKKKHKRHRKTHRRCPRADGGQATTGIQEDPAGTPARLGVAERELSATELQLQLSRPSVPAGSVIVEQQNDGEDPHNLVVQKGDDSAVFTYPTLDPGLTQKQTLPLSKGSWTLYCSLLDHKDLGMQATLIVD